MKIAQLRRPAASAGLLVLGMALGGCATTCVPGGVPPPPPRQSEAPMPPRGGRPDPAFHEALQACAQAQGITLPAPGQGAPADAGVRPDRDKLDACLKARGFEHPPGPPPGPGGPDGPGMPPPPRDPAFAAAFKACAAEQGVQLPAPGDKPVAPGEKPAPPAARPALDRDRLDACLSGKGFKRPAPGERDGGRPPAPVPAAS